jgi:hypothetical protein
MQVTFTPACIERLRIRPVPGPGITIPVDGKIISALCFYHQLSLDMDSNYLE